MRCNVQVQRTICQIALLIHGVNMTAVIMRMLELCANVCQPSWKIVLTLFPHYTESQFDYPVRLVNGNDSTEGLVEIYSPNATGMICDYLWDLHDATVVCRQLGFQGMCHCVEYISSSSFVLLRSVCCSNSFIFWYLSTSICCHLCQLSWLRVTALRVSRVYHLYEIC